VAACCLSILFGCNAKDQSGSQTIPPISPTSDPDDFVHDVGTVIAGSEVNYEFQIVNTSNERIVIEADTDIQRNCGCSSLEPSSRSVEPGSEARIKTRVGTTGKDGPFAYGGTITWASPAGDKRVVKLTLKGVAKSPFKCDPEVVSFLPDEIRKGVVKEVVLD